MPPGLLAHVRIATPNTRRGARSTGRAFWDGADERRPTDELMARGDSVRVP